MAKNEGLIAGLLRERAGYVAQGKDDRVKLVDVELKRLGYKSDDEENRKTPPQGRTADRPQQTTARPEVAR